VLLVAGHSDVFSTTAMNDLLRIDWAMSLNLISYLIATVKTRGVARHGALTWHARDTVLRLLQGLTITDAAGLDQTFAVSKLAVSEVVRRERQSIRVYIQMAV
jgi:hypothetical protein